MAQSRISSPGHPISTSRIPVAEPGSSGISPFTLWRPLGHRTAALALLPGTPAFYFPHPVMTNCTQEVNTPRPLLAQEWLGWGKGYKPQR